MKPAAILLAVALAAFAAFASAPNPTSASVQVARSLPTGITLSCDASRLALPSADIDPSVMIEAGEGVTAELGKPLLPRISRVIVVPPDRGLALEVSADDPVAIPVEGSVPVFTMTDSSGKDITAATQVDGLYPANFAEMSAPFIIRGVRMVRINTYPIQYDPAGHCYLRRDHIDAEVRFTDDPSINPVSHPIRRHRSEVFKRFIKDFALNGDGLFRDDPDRDQAPRYLGHYLVVIASGITNNVRPFIEWRRKQGYRVDILALSNDVATNADRVKESIQARYDAFLAEGEDPFDEILLVGDRTTYDRNPNPEAILQAPEGRSIWGGANHADYLYATLEGDDDNPDVGISRWIAGSTATLALFSGRTLSYESNPYFDNTEWLERAGVYFQNWGHTAEQIRPYQSRDVRWAGEVVERAGYADIRRYERTDWDQGGSSVGPHIRDWYNLGASLLVGKGNVYYWQNDFHGVNDNTVFPIHLNVSTTGNWTMANSTRNGDANHLKGPVAMTCAWGYGMPLAYNAVWMEMVSGVLQKDYPFGWARMAAINAIEGYLPDADFNGHGGVHGLIRTDFDVCGDPGIQPWVGVPRVVQARLTSVPTPHSNYFEVVVTDSDRQPVAGVDVSIYVPGMMPEDHTQYARYLGMFSAIGKSDADGHARIIVEADRAFDAREQFYVTVSGRDIKPAILEERFAVPEDGLDVNDWGLSELDGNGDGMINPGETWRILPNLLASGRNGVADLTATVSTDSPWIEIVGNGEIAYGDIQPGQQREAPEAVAFRVNPSCPDTRARPISTSYIKFACFDQIFPLKLVVAAPHIAFESIDARVLQREALNRLDIELRNTGQVRLGAADARLMSLSSRVIVTRPNSHYPEIGADQVAHVDAELFAVVGSPLAAPGQACPMAVVVTSGGFVDTTYFDLTVGEPGDGEPIGPDPYGYFCLDNTDERWEMAPEYEWIEINPDVQDHAFDGTRLQALENAQVEDDLGVGLAIALPFSTQFYGRMVDTITVTSMGYIAVGSQEGAVNYNNLPLDRCMGGAVGMIAPYWDDLDVTNNSRVFTAYDQERGRFIVEWYRWTDHSRQNPTQTFEVVLYDHRARPTATGDQPILFQYKTISPLANMRPGDQEMDNWQYASVGLSSPTGRSGLSYCFSNNYPTGAAPLADRRALLFTTDLRPNFGVAKLYGRVTEFQIGTAIPLATVSTSLGDFTVTDSLGVYELPILPERPTEVRFSAQGYCDSVVVNIQVPANDSLELNVELLAPHFRLSTDGLTTQLPQRNQRRETIRLSNDGTGTLDWRVEKHNQAGDNFRLGEVRADIAAGDSVHCERMEGVVWADGNFYGAGSRASGNNWIWKFSREGVVLDSFRQCGDAPRGFKDLEWDGTNLWGSGENTIWCFSPEGDVVRNFGFPRLNPTYNLAWDAGGQQMWIAGLTSRIYAISPEGEERNSLEYRGIRMSGLAYYPEDPDGYNLYITSSIGNSTVKIYKMNTETNDTMLVTTIVDTTINTARASAYITHDYDPNSWVYVALHTNTNPGGMEHIEVRQLGPAMTWFDLDPASGRVEPGVSRDLSVTFDATGFPPRELNGVFHFVHNALGSWFDVPVRLNILDGERWNPPSPLEPHSGDGVSAVSNPDDSIVVMPPITFLWQAGVENEPQDYRFWISGARESQKVAVQGTRLTLRIDTLGVPLEVNRGVLWWVSQVIGGEEVVCLEPNVLNILPNEVADAGSVPVEFGLRSIYPSPFNGRTTVVFGADRSDFTRVAACDITGREVEVVYSGRPSVGYHTLTWDAARLPSGVYLVSLESAGRKIVRKVALVR